MLNNNIQYIKQLQSKEKKKKAQSGLETPDISPSTFGNIRIQNKSVCIPPEQVFGTTRDALLMCARNKEEKLRKLHKHNMCACRGKQFNLCGVGKAPGGEGKPGVGGGGGLKA